MIDNKASAKHSPKTALEKAWKLTTQSMISKLSGEVYCTTLASDMMMSNTCCPLFPHMDQCEIRQQPSQQSIIYQHLRIYIHKSTWLLIINHHHHLLGVHVTSRLAAGSLANFRQVHPHAWRALHAGEGSPPSTGRTES